MENGSSVKWGFQGNKTLNAASKLTVGGVLETLVEKVRASDVKPTIYLGHGDPSSFPSFKTAPVAEESLVDAIRSTKFNCYAPATGLLPAKRSVADHLSKDLPYKLSADDIFLTVGAYHAIEVIISVLARPGANILLPRPGYPFCEARARYSNIEIRYFDLLPEKNWEVDLDGVEALADANTVAMLIISPGNPCGNVYTYQHLKQVAETTRKLGILLIADEVYSHLCFGSKPFVPGGVFGSITPVITLGTISKRWMIPGWRIGWIAINDPKGILHKHGLVESIKSYISISAQPATFTQAALPQILEGTTNDFFSKIINIFRQDADICYNGLNDIPCFTCSYKPEGTMSCLVKLNLSFLEGIDDDMDFCIKLAKEESVVILPGFSVGLKNWLRITFAVEPAYLQDGLRRIKHFYMSKKGTRLQLVCSTNVVGGITKNTRWDQHKWLLLEHYQLTEGECRYLLQIGSRIFRVSPFTRNLKDLCLACMVKLNLSLLKGINDDTETCIKLAEEESVIVLPGFGVGLKNWIRINFAVEPASLKYLAY